MKKRERAKVSGQERRKLFLGSCNNAAPGDDPIMELASSLFDKSGRIKSWPASLRKNASILPSCPSSKRPQRAQMKQQASELKWSRQRFELLDFHTAKLIEFELNKRDLCPLKGGFEATTSTFKAHCF